MGKEKTIYDVNDKLKSIRNIYPDFSNSLYAIADYMSIIVDKDISSQELISIIPTILNDISKGQCSKDESIKLPKYILDNKLECIEEIKNIPQIFDILGEDDFAKDIRDYCTKVFGYNSPRINKMINEIKYPEYIETALNWWVKTIQTPNIDTRNNFLKILSLTFPNKSYTKNEICIFRNALGNSIKNEIERFGECNISVEYSPCIILQEACNSIGVSSLSYPPKMSMKINRDEVIVENKLERTKQVIWSNEKRKQFQRIKTFNK